MQKVKIINNKLKINKNFLIKNMNFKITLLLILVLASFAQADLQACYDIC